MQHRKILLLFLLTGSAILLALAVYLSQTQSRPALPDELGGYTLDSNLHGPEAVKRIVFSHLGEFVIVDGAVGEYGGGVITVWMAEAGSEKEADQLVLDMTNRIPEVESPFTSMGQLNRQGRVIYLLEGQGQVHFYFQSQKLVIWAAAYPELGEKVLNQLLNFYP
jgi:hypothetical protein